MALKFKKYRISYKISDYILIYSEKHVHNAQFLLTSVNGGNKFCLFCSYINSSENYTRLCVWIHKQQLVVIQKKLLNFEDN